MVSSSLNISIASYSSWKLVLASRDPRNEQRPQETLAALTIVPLVSTRLDFHC